jgi:hypothetical protein
MAVQRWSGAGRGALVTTRKTPEPGCYGDGTFGHQHTRQRCAEQVEFTRCTDPAWRRAVANGRMRADDLIDSLLGPMPDDAGDELDACDWLNTWAPLDGHHWDWLDGDLGLWPDDSAGDL